MPLPMNMVCSACHRDGLHQWQGSAWVSLCCGVPWVCSSSKPVRAWYDSTAEQRARGGQRARLNPRRAR